MDVCAALLEIYWFEWTYFHKRALLFPQRCCQGHGAGNAASRGDQLIPAAAGSGFASRCWKDTVGGEGMTAVQLAGTAVPVLAALLKIARRKAA